MTAITLRLVNDISTYRHDDTISFRHSIQKCMLYGMTKAFDVTVAVSQAIVDKAILRALNHTRSRIPIVYTKLPSQQPYHHNTTNITTGHQRHSPTSHWSLRCLRFYRNTSFYRVSSELSSAIGTFGWTWHSDRTQYSSPHSTPNLLISVTFWRFKTF